MVMLCKKPMICGIWSCRKVWDPLGPTLPRAMSFASVTIYPCIPIAAQSVTVSVLLTRW
jgi:hypothetical protein